MYTSTDVYKRQIEGTALAPAILQIASEGSVAVMNDAYRERLEQYLASMLQAKQMLRCV